MKKIVTAIVSISGYLLAIDLDKVDSLVNKDAKDSLVFAAKKAIENTQNSSIVDIGIKMAIMLLIVIVFIYLFVYVIKKFQDGKKIAGSFDADMYKILGAAPLTYNKHLQLIKFNGKVYLLAVSEKDVTLIDKIENSETIEELENRTNSDSSRFSKLLKINLDKLRK
ncbi:MAG: flagellar biosynthetic protein FliO [Candidatus Delongbacteria bacterium]|nr:flagellar biosynthetic protein FliO [Candidatus Delongbacteria bacterium]MBN2835678.1 flagellar biosynthetic protein FliO [Candidatus Delongbacteria bacterium]